MRKHIFFALVVSSTFALAAVAEEKNLPADSKILLQKLTEFEESERLKFEKRVSEKRKQVATLLARHQEIETKSGNLDGAIAVRKVIDRLSEPNGAPLIETPSPQKPAGAPETDWFLERTWAIENRPQAYTFKLDGAIWKSVNGQITQKNYKWKLMKSGALEIRGENSPLYFWLDSSRRGESTAIDERIDGLKIERRD